MDAQQQDAAQQKVFDLVKSIEVAQMVTIAADGKLRSRPMVAKQNSFAGDLWFFASATSGKVDELDANREVLLTYSDPSKQNYVSVEGEGEVVRDSQRAQRVRDLWSEPLRVWFPKGPSDPDIALVRVRMREARYWDAPSSAFLLVYGYVKAVTTGQRPNPGDVGQVEIHNHG